MTIDELFARHRALALDSNVLIYMLEGLAPQGIVAQAIIDGIEAGRADAATASVTLTEVLARSAAAGDTEAFERLDGDLWALGGITVVPMDRRIAVEATRARGEGRTLADAIHMATAKLSEATAFITNDRRIQGRDGVEVVLLSDITLPEPVESDSGST